LATSWPLLECPLWSSQDQPRPGLAPGCGAELAFQVRSKRPMSRSDARFQDGRTSRAPRRIEARRVAEVNLSRTSAIGASPGCWHRGADGHVRGSSTRPRRNAADLAVRAPRLVGRLALPTTWGCTGRRSAQ